MLPELVTSTPGAIRLTQVPKLLQLNHSSSMSEPPTVMTSGSCAGLALQASASHQLVCKSIPNDSNSSISHVRSMAITDDKG